MYGARKVPPSSSKLPLLKDGVEEQRAEYLSLLCRGQRRMVVSLTMTASTWSANQSMYCHVL